jgi:hypothetical protein
MKIVIEEIKNGFILYLFEKYPSPTELDGEIYVKTLEEAFKYVKQWAQNVKDAKSEAKK